MCDIPSSVQMGYDLAVVLEGVRSVALGDCTEVVKKVGVFAIEHQLPGHGDFALEHRFIGEHSSVGILVHDLTDHAGVKRFVSRLVGCNLAADQGQIVLASEQQRACPRCRGVIRVARSWKDCVNEPLVFVIPARCKPASDQMMNSPLDREHVDPAGEPEIGVDQIAVPVLFRSPPSQPARPRR